MLADMKVGEINDSHKCTQNNTGNDKSEGAFDYDITKGICY
jgi:hypothetical protein